MTPQKVQVFGLGLPEKGAPKEKRRYFVRWRVDGRDRMRSFKTKGEAERLRAQLQTAVMAGQLFDFGSGMPAEWVSSGETWWTWSRPWLQLKWPGWSGNSRRSAVESLVALTPFMVRPGAPKPPGDLRCWLRTEGFELRGELDRAGEMARWLVRCSVRLNDMQPGVLEAALTGATTRADGKAMSAEVIRRRRTTLNAVLKMAVRRGHLDANPMEKVEWKVPDRTLAVDISTVPSFKDIAAIVDFTKSGPSASRRYAALFGCVGFSGMRPSEAMGLRVDDLTLPTQGWGLATLRGATTTPGIRFTNDDEVFEDKELKQRAVGAVRAVPLSPVLVALLEEHLVAFPPVDGRVFTTSKGTPMSSTSYSVAWKRARAHQWPGSSVLADVTLYDLRHSAATLMLRAGVMPAEVARRLGHSVDVLMRTYAGVFDDEADRSNLIIEQEQDRQLEG